MIIGAMADSVQDVIGFEDSNILEVPELGFNYNAEFILGMLKNENSFTMILDIDKVFSTEDVDVLNVAAKEVEEVKLEENKSIPEPSDKTKKAKSKK
jgi:purine-binding chemotaxis protein CheW